MPSQLLRHPLLGAIIAWGDGRMARLVPLGAGLLWRIGCPLHDGMWVVKGMSEGRQLPGLKLFLRDIGQGGRMV